MAESDKLTRIKSRISEIASRRKNVELEDIEWVANQLKDTYPVSTRDARHGRLYSIAGRRFMVNHHNPGQKQVKAYSVDDFLEVMGELGLYED